MRNGLPFDFLDFHRFRNLKLKNRIWRFHIELWIAVDERAHIPELQGIDRIDGVDVNPSIPWIGDYIGYK